MQFARPCGRLALRVERGTSGLGAGVFVEIRQAPAGERPPGISNFKIDALE